jgi:hypothetical protein
MAATEAYPVSENKEESLESQMKKLDTDDPNVDAAAKAAGDGVLEMLSHQASKKLEAENKAPSAEKTRVRRKSKDLEDMCMKFLKPDLERAFKAMDKNGDGTLQRYELAEALSRAGRPATDDVIDASMKIMDKNGDGVIDFEEFVSIAFHNMSQG